MLVVVVDLGAVAVDRNGLARHSSWAGRRSTRSSGTSCSAARAEGLGGVMTTMLCREEPRPRSSWASPTSRAIAALVALGRPRRRSPASPASPWRGSPPSTASRRPLHRSVGNLWASRAKVAHRTPSVGALADELDALLAGVGVVALLVEEARRGRARPRASAAVEVGLGRAAASTPCSAMNSAHSTSASTISSSGTTATFLPLTNRWPRLLPAAMPRSASRASPGPLTTQPMTATWSGISRLVERLLGLRWRRRSRRSRPGRSDGQAMRSTSLRSRRPIASSSWRPAWASSTGSAVSE